MKKVIKSIIEVGLPMLLVSFVIWLFSKKFEISLIWILSPFWMIIAILIAALILAIIKMPFALLADIIKLKKGDKNGHSNNSKTNV